MIAVPSMSSSHPTTVRGVENDGFVSATLNASVCASAETRCTPAITPAMTAQATLSGNLFVIVMFLSILRERTPETRGLVERIRRTALGISPMHHPRDDL